MKIDKSDHQQLKIDEIWPTMVVKKQSEDWPMQMPENGGRMLTIVDFRVGYQQPLKNGC